MTLTISCHHTAMQHSNSITDCSMTAHNEEDAAASSPSEPMHVERNQHDSVWFSAIIHYTLTPKMEATS